MIWATATFKVFWSSVLPLAALACVWFAVLFAYRGLRLLILRIGILRGGLHAGSALPRTHADGGTRYVPVFSYTTRCGEEVDILGSEEFFTAADAMKARRALVYEAERPDAAMAHNVLTFMARPLVLLAFSASLVVISHYLLLYMPD